MSTFEERYMQGAPEFAPGGGTTLHCSCNCKRCKASNHEDCKLDDELGDGPELKFDVVDNHIAVEPHHGRLHLAHHMKWVVVTLTINIVLLKFEHTIYNATLAHLPYFGVIG